MHLKIRTLEVAIEMSSAKTKVEKYPQKSSLLVQFETLLKFKPVTLLKMISLAGILQRFWPEVQNRYIVEHLVMAILENFKIRDCLLD